MTSSCILRLLIDTLVVLLLLLMLHDTLYDKHCSAFWGLHR